MAGLIIEAIDVFFGLLDILIFLRILFSWIPGLPNSPLGKLVHGVTEPILGPVRDLVHKSPLGSGLMLDFSPVIAIFILELVRVIFIRAVILIL